MNKSIDKVIFILIITSFLIIFVYPFFLFPCCDDMFYRHIIKDKNIINFTLSEGLHIDSRWLTPLAFIRNIIFKFLPHSIALIFYLTTFFVALWILLKALDNNSKNWIFISLFLLIEFYGINKISSETIYWEAGGYYVLNLLVVAIWFWTLENFLNNSNKKNFYFYLISSLFAGTLSYNFTAGLLVYGFIKAITLPKFNKRAIWGLLIIITLQLVLVMLPSSTSRTDLLNLPMPKIVLNIFKNTFRVSFNYINISKWAVLAGIILGFFKSLIKENKEINDLKISNWKDLLNYFVLPLSAFATISPFLIAPHLASPRTALLFTILMSLFFYKLSYDFVNIVLKPTIAPNLFKVLTIILLTVHILYFLNVIYITYDVKKQYLARYKFLKEQAKLNKSKVYVKPISYQEVPFSLNYFYQNDLTENTNSWKNNQYETVFGIDTILISTQ